MAPVDGESLHNNQQLLPLTPARAHFLETAARPVASGVRCYPYGDDVRLEGAAGAPDSKVGADEPTKQQGGRAKDALLAVANGDTAI